MRHLHFGIPIAHLSDPNANLRARISQMAAIGLPDYQIAFMVRIALETLRAFFAAEMQSAAAAANVEVLHTLFQLAKSGKYPSVTMFWAKTRCAFQPHSEKKNESLNRFEDPPPIMRVVNNDGEPVHL